MLGKFSGRTVQLMGRLVPKGSLQDTYFSSFLPLITFSLSLGGGLAEI